MNGAPRLLGDIAFIAVIVGLPALYLVYSDRFKRLPDPRQFAILFVVVTLAGILLDLPALAVIAATVVLGVGLAWLTSRYALTGLSYARTVYPQRLFPGDEAELTVCIENRKLLPLAWLRVLDPITFRQVRNDRKMEDVLAFSGGIVRPDIHQYALSNEAALGPYQSLTRRYTVTAKRRGVYRLGPAKAESGDLFGMFNTGGPIGQDLEVLVYPHVYQPDEIAVPFREAFGELIPHRALLEDPTLLAGSREYRPGDPLHHMHWKASARSGQLQVRVCDPSTTANLLIVLSINTYRYLWEGIDVARMEEAIDAAASLAVWGLDKGYAVGLAANAAAVGAEGGTRIAPSASPHQSARILDRLARISAASRFSAHDMLIDEGKRLDARTSIILVTPILSPEVIDAVNERRLRGRVSVVYTGDQLTSVPGLPIYQLLPRSFRAAS